MKVNKNKKKWLDGVQQNGQKQPPLDISLETGKVDDVKEFFYLERK